MTSRRKNHPVEVACLCEMTQLTLVLCEKEVPSQTSLTLSEGESLPSEIQGAWVVLVEAPGFPVAFGVDVAKLQPLQRSVVDGRSHRPGIG